jgi:hypothetical protein
VEKITSKEFVVGVSIMYIRALKCRENDYFEKLQGKKHISNPKKSSKQWLMI